MATQPNMGGASALPFIHPDDMPDVHALRGYGTCMEPLVADGALIVADKREKPEPGDLVSITFTREAAERWRVPGMVKKLALGLPPMDMPEDGDVVGLVVADQINPPRRFAFPTTDVLSVYKIVGTAEMNADGTARYCPPPG